MSKYRVVVLIAVTAVAASLSACAPDHASAPYSQMVAPNAQFGAAGGAGGGGGAGGM